MKYVLSIFLIVLFAFGCDSTEPINKGKLYISTEDVSCTEAWIKVTVNDVALPAELQLFRNDSVAQVINLSKSDTLIYEDNLAPSTEYNYTAKLAGINSGIAAVRTMDTTSHDFTWETFTFGGGSSGSLLNDVAIVDENNIWAVGEIHTPETDQFDSNGVWVQPYNAVHWDGNQWEFIRIADLFYPRRTVYAFDEKDIWFDGAIKWNGSKYEVHRENFPVDNNGNAWEVNGMWGLSNSDFYVVGNGGNIAHYNGSKWEKIDSPADGINQNNISDIYGTINIQTNLKEVYISIPDQGNVFKIDEQNKITKIEIPDSRFFRKVWTKNGLAKYVTGFGIIKEINDIWKVELEGSSKFITDIDGTDHNNVVACGTNGQIYSYNGKSWFNHYELYSTNIWYKNLSVKGDIVVITGEKRGNEIEGIISIGRKN